MAYNGVKNIDSKPKMETNIKRKNQHILASAFLCLLAFSCINFSVLSGSAIGAFIKRVTLNWTPKPEDMGKIKFVNFSFNSNGDNSGGIFIVSSPFKSYFASNVSATCLEVNGLGDVVVISPISGVVQTIETKNGKSDISIVNGNVLVKLMGLSFACIDAGNRLEEGQKIGISLESKINFSILCDGKYIELPASGKGDTFFE